MNQGHETSVETSRIRCVWRRERETEKKRTKGILAGREYSGPSYRERMPERVFRLRFWTNLGKLPCLYCLYYMLGTVLSWGVNLLLGICSIKPSYESIYIILIHNVIFWCYHYIFQIFWSVFTTFYAYFDFFDFYLFWFWRVYAEIYLNVLTDKFTFLLIGCKCYSKNNCKYIYLLCNDWFLRNKTYANETYANKTYANKTYASKHLTEIHFFHMSIFNLKQLLITLIFNITSNMMLFCHFFIKQWYKENVVYLFPC